jgi:hypothetical protein
VFQRREGWATRETWYTTLERDFGFSVRPAR